MWRIPLCRTEFGEAEIEAVAAVLRSGWLAAGAVTQEFEERFARRIGVRHAIAVSSGTAALHLAHVGLGIGKGDEVVCPSLSFVASANAARYTGAQVIFADVIGAEEPTVDPADIARKLSERTRAVTVMHYGGFSCRMQQILALTREAGVAVIEDCAHAPLARATDPAGAVRSVGALGDVGCFSFYGNKNLPTGEGGMVTTDDDGLADRIRRLRSHGMSRDSWDRYRGRLSGYEIEGLGFNYRFDDLRAAIGLVRLDALDDLTERRREVFSRYVELFGTRRGIRVPFAERDLSTAAPHILCVVLDDPQAAAGRCTESGIQTSRHYDPINGFEAYGADPRSTPVAAALGLLTLPFDAGLARHEIEEIVNVVCG
jgi:dTDP-4-amino-4,6-dideoxygalactose transaminase